MPLRGAYQLNREGVTIDTIFRLIARTALNPALTVPLLLALQYHPQGRVLAARHATAVQRLKWVLGFALVRQVSNWLDSAVTNNWTSDTYDWGREVVVVTGGSEGIGRGVVELLAERGVRVAVLDIRDLTFEAPPSVRFFRCDLTSPSEITSSITSITNTLGAPTILINNAGVAYGKSILATTPRDLSLTFQVNTFSHYHLVQAVLPSMIAHNHGMIVTVASAAGFVTAPSMVDYASSKAAAISFHEGLAAEISTLYHAPKVRTVLITQGFTQTTLFRGFKPGDPWVNYALHPMTVAEEIVRCVLQGRSRHVCLPGIVRYMAMGVRGWSEWAQYALRKRGVELMRGWQGRMVEQKAGDEGSRVVGGEEVSGVREEASSEKGEELGESVESVEGSGVLA